jgi:NADH pyrophosphatase NudC (nudix superfamily)
MKCGAALVRRMLAGRERALCSAAECGFVHWDNPLPVAAALIQCADRGGRVLLARNRGWVEGKFGLVTGFIEHGEDAEEAARREMKEEVGLDAQALHLIGVYPYPARNEIVIAYHVVGTGEIVLNEELVEYRLVEPAKLKPWGFGTGLAVRDWLRFGAAAIRPEDA